MTKSGRLDANFTKTSLIVPESRVVAGLLLAGVDEETWRTKIVQENVLQKRTTNTAKSYASIARHRLETMDAQLWELIRDSSLTLATQAVLSATLKFSPLLALFMRTALADEYRRRSQYLEPSVWNRFFEDCAMNHQNLADATPMTRDKLRQNAFRILTEAGYLGVGKSKPLQHPRIQPEIRAYLQTDGENEILAAMECAQ